MSDDGITKVKRDKSQVSKPDWARFDAVTEAERHAAALDDPDAKPATEEQLAAGRRRPDLRVIREAMSRSVEAFATRFGLSPVLVREWEAGTRWPDRTAQMLLRLIEREPDLVAKVAAE